MRGLSRYLERATATFWLEPAKSVPPRLEPALLQLALCGG
jgi:hypothetical protein